MMKLMIEMVIDRSTLISTCVFSLKRRRAAASRPDVSPSTPPGSWAALDHAAPGASSATALAKHSTTAFI
jgi:hypothetical protein